MAKELMEIGGFITEGAEIVNHDNTLSGNGTVDSPLRVVPGYNETVLWSGTPTSAVTLSESMQNFDYVRLYLDLGANDRPKPVMTCRYSPVMTVSWAQGVANAFQTIAYISANPTAMKIVHTRQVALGSLTNTAATNTTGTLDETNSVNSITKVHRRKPYRKLVMDQIVEQLISSGPVGIVCAAVVYIIIAVQRNNTKKTRDDDSEKMVTRIALLEDKMEKIEELDLAGKLAAIQVDISWIKQKLMEKK